MAREPDWGHLQRRMFKTAVSRGLPALDADDIVQEAIYKILKRANWTQENLEKYLFRALRDKEAEYWRGRTGREMALVDTDDEDGSSSDPLERWSPPRPDVGLDFLLTESAVRRVLDDGVMAYAVLHAMGFTGRQIARRLGWSHAQTEAARIRLARKRRAVALAVLEHIPEHIEGEVRNVD